MFEISCTHCLTKFYVKERRHVEGKRARKFCSISCASSHNYTKNKEKILETSFKKGHAVFPKGLRKPKEIKPPKRLYGSDNPAFTHGKRCGHAAKLYKKIAQENFEQYCLICLSTQHLHVHHIDTNKLNNSINNLCVLCNSCHQRLHKLMDKERLLTPLDAVEILKNRKCRYKFKTPPIPE